MPPSPCTLNVFTTSSHLRSSRLSAVLVQTKQSQLVDPNSSAFQLFPTPTSSSTKKIPGALRVFILSLCTHHLSSSLSLLLAHAANRVRALHPLSSTLLCLKFPMENMVGNYFVSVRKSIFMPLPSRYLLCQIKIYIYLRTCDTIFSQKTEALSCCCRCFSCELRHRSNQ